MADGDVEIRARAVVLAAGGFESNLEWLAEIWGEAAGNFIIRGTPYNTGTVLRLMLDAGAEPVGDPAQCHAVAIDARAPKFDGGIVTRLDSRAARDRRQQARRSVLRRRRGLLAEALRHLGAPRRAAAGSDRVFDRRRQGRSAASCRRCFRRSSRARSASWRPPSTCRPGTLTATVERFNGAVRPGTFDHQALDDCRTDGLVPNKTHWAQRLDTPPFWAYPLRPGITFTYLGVKVDERARVVMQGGAADNIFAAGEIMAGNILGKGYVAGVGMTIGTVFGEIAGRSRIIPWLTTR